MADEGRNQKQGYERGFGLGTIGRYTSGDTEMGGYIQQNVWKPTQRSQPIAAEHNSPGPASVNLPSYFGNATRKFDSKRGVGPAFSCGIKLEQKREDAGPGPAQYDTSNSKTTGGKVTNTAPRLPPRNGDSKKSQAFVTPGPAYDITLADNQVYSHSPSWVIKKYDKPKSDVNKHDSPGPIYELPPYIGASTKIHDSKRQNAPAYTFGIRAPDTHINQTPGPNEYNIPAQHVYKQNPPQFSLSSRVAPPGDTTQKPGPGSHSPEKVFIHKPIPPGYSFGLRHTNFMTPYPNFY